MIKASFKLSAQNEVLSFELSGHSGAAESGKDIVCAAVSGAVQTVIAVLDGQMGFTECFSVRDDEENSVFCDISALKGEDRKIADTVLKGFKILMEEWEKDFPKNIKLNITTV
jgi:hypothetical protein